MQKSIINLQHFIIMKKKTVLFLLPAFAFALAAAPVLTSCSDDEGNDDPVFVSP